MKRIIRIGYADFVPGFVPEQQSWHKSLSKHYEFIETDNPDYLIDGGLGWEHLNYNCIKILMLGENYVPDFNCFDYAVGFDHLAFGDRYIRHPLFAFYQSFNGLISREWRSDEWLLNRGFCSFVVSNSRCADPIRKKFFDRLSQYKRVDSGGRYLNNVGGPVADKIDFCRNYKFNIAFENSSSPGYTTEKIMEAYAAHSIPIYFGNPTIETDFRTESMVRVMGEDDVERAVEEVIRLDNDDAAYLAKCRECCFAVSDPHIYNKSLEEFLIHIFEQPIEQACRRNQYGYQAFMYKYAKRKIMAGDHKHKHRTIRYRISKTFRKMRQHFK